MLFSSLKRCLPQNFKKKTRTKFVFPASRRLLLLYPSTAEKQITLKNCFFLVKLAHEYQMDAIVKRCEDFLVDELKTKPKDRILSDLVFAQTYKLEKLRQASVDRAQNVYAHYLEEYNQIQSENLKEIVEGIIRRLQRESEESQRINDENKKIICSCCPSAAWLKIYKNCSIEALHCCLKTKN